MRRGWYGLVAALALALLGVGGCARPHARGFTAAPPASGRSLAPSEPPPCIPPAPDQVGIGFATDSSSSNLLPLCRDVYVEAGVSDSERARLRTSYSEAVRAVSEVLGPWQGEWPRTLYCVTNACRRYFAGATSRSRALAPGTSAPGGLYVASERPTILVLQTDAGARGLTAHEMAHVEVYARLRNAVAPDWFHEGLAAVVSDAPSCADHPPKGIDDLRRLDGHVAWEEHVNVVSQQHPTYCQAKAEVAAWLEGNGRSRLVQVLAALREGASFYDAYGPLRTCESGCTGPLGIASPARLRFYPLDDKVGTTAADLVHPNDASHAALLLGGASWAAGHHGSAVKVSGGKSFVRTDAIDGIGIVDRPFSLELWVKPAADAGILVHASVKPSGGDGWCQPFLGFDEDGRLVGQVLYAFSETSFLVARGPKLPLGSWSHVAMTWSLKIDRIS